MWPNRLVYNGQGAESLPNPRLPSRASMESCSVAVCFVPHAERALARTFRGGGVAAKHPS